MVTGVYHTSSISSSFPGGLFCIKGTCYKNKSKNGKALSSIKGGITQWQRSSTSNNKVGVDTLESPSEQNGKAGIGLQGKGFGCGAHNTRKKISLERSRMVNKRRSIFRHCLIIFTRKCGKPSPEPNSPPNKIS